MNTPNTIPYMIGGYLAFAVILTVYLVSLALRFRRLRRDLRLLGETEPK